MRDSEKSQKRLPSLHKPHTARIPKGRAHKRYGFGNKVGPTATMGGRIIITAIGAFEGDPHDSRTIAPLLEQGKRPNGHLPKELVHDRGGTGKSGIMGVAMAIPKPPPKRDTQYRKRKKRKKFGRRAAIGPVIGHLKKQFRMQRNYLMGKKAPTVNAMLAATGWNLKKLMEKLVEEKLYPFFKLLSFALLIEDQQKLRAW